MGGQRTTGDIRRIRPTGRRLKNREGRRGVIDHQRGQNAAAVVPVRNRVRNDVARKRRRLVLTASVQLLLAAVVLASVIPEGNRSVSVVIGMAVEPALMMPIPNPVKGLMMGRQTPETDRPNGREAD